MAKVLIIEWIILHCFLKSFKGMRWHDSEEGIFWLYWRHQSSRSCRENTDDASSWYEYYRAWAKHKNNNRLRQPRDLKAAFRNALEKKPELERVKSMDTKERIYWRIINFPDYQKGESAQSPVKKSRGKKPANDLIQNGDKFPINFGASTSAAGQDVPVAKRKSREPTKGRKKTKRYLIHEEDVSMSSEPPINGLPDGLEEANNQPPLPPFLGTFANTDRTDLPNILSQTPQFPDNPYEKTINEDMWTPQFFSHTDRFSPPQLSSDPMEASTSDMMDLLIPNQRIDYSFQPTPPQQTTDILFENFTGADLMTSGKIIHGGEPTILKCSFPFQPKEVPTSQPHQTNTNAQAPAVTQLHCSVPDFTSPTKTSSLQNNNNCALDSRTTTASPVNAFLFDQKQCSYDQVVPPYCETFPQTSQQVIDTSEVFVNDCLLYSPPPSSMTHHRHTSEKVSHKQAYTDEMCHQHAGTDDMFYQQADIEEMFHQQADTVSQSFELLNYNDQDDSGISDMEDFLECANKLLDDIDSKSDGQCYIFF